MRMKERERKRERERERENGDKSSKTRNGLERFNHCGKLIK